jgi:hypothetical protein
MWVLHSMRYRFCRYKILCSGSDLEAVPPNIYSDVYCRAILKLARNGVMFENSSFLPYPFCESNHRQWILRDNTLPFELSNANQPSQDTSVRSRRPRESALRWPSKLRWPYSVLRSVVHEGQWRPSSALSVISSPIPPIPSSIFTRNGKLKQPAEPTQAWNKTRVHSSFAVYAETWRYNPKHIRYTADRRSKVVHYSNL